MSLNKAIEHGKEYREPYRGSKAINPTCRNHGGDSWAERNRTYKYDKWLEGDLQQISEIEKGE